MLGGLEIHPAIVHFPIALTTVGALFAVLYLLMRLEWIRWFAHRDAMHDLDEEIQQPINDLLAPLPTEGRQ